MIDALRTAPSRRITVVLLLAGGVLALGATIVGINDNPPGLILTFAAALAAVYAFVHPWRDARKYLTLALLSVLAFVALVLLHNLLHGFAEAAASDGMWAGLLEGIGVAAFLGAVLVCPPAFVIGVLRAVQLRLRAPADDFRNEQIRR